ncbi:Smr/MutS family endonuclease [Sansalvadorimonas sp. 2012CJ34-2]|uniref:Smr/MutS family endonuclease n=1 Tax=Parendozoicomonas callyspongiae TaxID=2942213 RepID=A0ABT0PBR6_9GAMM|nr:Smr/MutS family protein [Sansalvadorimonas sp. 2012CJ34-2]MCL6268666.1 Smr/MutS family endonuclease [Sansalvadorimonas sp. 2012CJ34-2]
MVTDDDKHLFSQEMSGVKPLKQNKSAAPTTGQKKIPEFTLRLRRRQAVEEQADIEDGLSDTHIVAIGPEEYIEHTGKGLQHKRMNKLRHGQIEVRYNLDLHGLTFEEARDMLLRFIAFSRNNHYSCVRVIHGKSHKAWHGQQDTMKSYVNAWLKQISGVLGFASCLPVDGGTGAVYILLSNSR